jgi:protein tyrosine/serine phosphatase
VKSGGMMRAYAGLILVLLSVVAFGCASRPPTSSQPVAGIDNFGIVSPDLWRGARPNIVGMQTLKQMGVKTIIDLEDRDASAEIPPGVNYVRLPVSPFRCDRVDGRALLNAIATSSRPIFIHCRQGRDRTGLAVAIYRCKVEGMSSADAIRELHAYNVHPWWVWSMESKIRALGG